MIDIKKLMEEIHENAVKKGFWDQQVFGKTYIVPRNKGEMIALIHSELSEALEGVREPAQDTHCPEYTSEEVEMADALIRILDYCEGHKLRLIEAIEAKMKYNATRPYKHGKEF